MGQRLVVVGGDAGGMAAAAEARRRDPTLDIVALEKGRWTSYSACGIPYLVGGEVESIDRLIARHPQEFRDQLNIDVRTEAEVTGIDLAARSIEVRDHGHQRDYKLGFDLLHLATGAIPNRPPLPGIEAAVVHGIQTVEDAAHLLEHGVAGLKQVVVVGGGYIGLEIAEAFVRRGAAVTVVERGPEVMGTLDPDMGALVSAAMRSEGIEVLCATAVTAFTEGSVITDAGELAADAVVLGTGVLPNTRLAIEAGVPTGERGAIAVDRRQRTHVEGVSAAGDCCESFHLVSGRHVYVALGTVANKQARVAGINLGGGYATFPGVVGTAATRLCSTEVARTGLNEREALEAGFAFEAVRVESATRAGYLADSTPITAKVLVERGTGRLLGGQLVGGPGTAKRIDVLATAITAGWSAEDLIQADLAYAPVFSPLWDPVQVAARRAAGVLEGRTTPPARGK